MKKFNPATLPYLGALVQAVLFAIAGFWYFDLGLWGAVAGFGVGAVVNLSLAVASSRISEIAQKRQPLARLMLWVMMLLSPATIALSFFAPKSVAAAIAWAADVDIAIVLTGAIAGKSLVAQEQPQKPVSEPERTKKTRSATRSAKSAKGKSAQRSLSDIPCRFAGAGCDRTFASQNAANAHARNCGFKPIAVDLQVEKSEHS